MRVQKGAGNGHQSLLGVRWQCPGAWEDQLGIVAGLHPQTYGRRAHHHHTCHGHTKTPGESLNGVPLGERGQRPDFQPGQGPFGWDTPAVTAQPDETPVPEPVDYQLL